MLETLKKLNALVQIEQKKKQVHKDAKKSIKNTRK